MVQVYAYIDGDGIVRVSDHLGSTEAVALDDRGLVPIRMGFRMNIEDVTVFDSEQDADRVAYASRRLIPAETFSDCPGFDVEDRAIELRAADTILAEPAQKQYGLDGWPEIDPEWRDR